MLALDPDDAAVVIAAWPTGHADFRLLRWLIDTHGIPWGDFAVHCMQPRVAAYNDGVATALASGKKHLVFCDHDVIPTAANAHHGSTDQFFDECEGDIICCPCRLDIEGAWSSPTAFHCGMWRTTRSALKKVKPRWFMEEYSSDGRKLETCVCAYFARKARDVGLTVSRAGWAEHKTRR